MLRVREEAIVDVVNRLLADRGYEQMTVDEVAAEVGIAKASLYKHFPSKEALAAAAMVRTLQRAQAVLAELAMRATMQPAERLRAVVLWIMQMQYEGAMPSLPAENSTLRNVLMADKGYTGLLMEVSETLGGWIEQAQQAGEIDRSLPPEVVLFTLYARACDPVLPLLKASGQYSREQIFEWMLSTCFAGLATRPA
ncbi:MAG: TetR/AcrR family transcriptional regulator [Rubrivivax sp.]|nr:TetR/AcrR family transcriptional regulator [Rubrivivax sp.]